MNPSWKTFLESQSAYFDADGLTCFEAEAGPDVNQLFDLSQLGLIRIQGEDARSFMQGQLTNDSRALSPSLSQLSALCSPKGRMLGLFRILETANGFILILPRELREAVQKRLQMLVLRARLSLAAVDDLIVIGLAGAGSEAQVEALMGAPLTRTDAVLHANGVSCVRLGGTLARFLFLVDAAQAPSLWQQLALTAKPASGPMWKLLTIRAGEPVVYAATVEAFVPQMANLHLVNGLSFTKGCYTGQEVVARMQYLGKLKRHMYRARVATGQAPLPGDELFSSDSTSGQGTGRVAESAPSPDGGWELLVVMEASQRLSPVHLGSGSGPRLEFLDLPYAFETADAD